MSRPLLAMVLGLLATAISLAPRPAAAHLIPAGRGTLNVVNDAVFAVLSVPVSSLQDADDDRNGTVDASEFERHEAALRAEIDRRMVILDGETAATTVRVDLVLSPQHEATQQRDDQVVVLKHVRFAAPPRDLRLRCDLFGASPSAQELSVTATRRGASGKESQAGVLRPASPEQAFFQPAALPPPPARPLPRSLFPLVALAGLVAATAGVAKTTASRNGTGRSAASR